MNDPIKVTLKFFVYIIGKVAAVLCALFVILLAFLTAMNTMNVQVLIKDAFALRSSVMLKQTDNDDTELLDRVFSEEYIEENGLKTLSDNRAYDVTNYNQDTDAEFKLIWPWDKEVTLEVTDVVEDVRATLVNDTVDASLLKKDYLMDSGTYDVTVSRTEDGWIIEDVQMKETIEPEILFPLPTPDPKKAESAGEDIEATEDAEGEEDGQEE